MMKQGRAIFPCSQTKFVKEKKMGPESFVSHASLLYHHPSKWSGHLNVNATNKVSTRNVSESKELK